MVLLNVDCRLISWDLPWITAVWRYDRCRISCVVYRGTGFPYVGSLMVYVTTWVFLGFPLHHPRGIWVPGQEGREVRK